MDIARIVQVKMSFLNYQYSVVLLWWLLLLIEKQNTFYHFSYHHVLFAMHQNN